MVKINSESFFINLWNSFPHPCFVIYKNLEIIDLNSKAEIFFMASKKRLIGNKITDFVEKGSLLLKVIDQINLKQAPVVIYDLNIFFGKKEFGKFDVYSSPLEGSPGNVLIVMNFNP